MLFSFIPSKLRSSFSESSLVSSHRRTEKKKKNVKLMFFEKSSFLFCISVAVGYCICTENYNHLISFFSYQLEDLKITAPSLAIFLQKQIISCHVEPALTPARPLSQKAPFPDALG